VVAQVGIAGSTKLGNYVTLAGQSGVAGHLTLGDRVVVMGKSGVMRSIGAGEKWFGYPAKPDRQMKRQLVVMDQLPELLNRVIELEKKLSSLAPGGAAPQSPAQA
jgi:UDP-3-O-[3-hydroxymyristoyl] glucosamine N-acyltransferase